MKNRVMRTASGMMVLGALLFAVAPATARTMSPAAGHTARVVIDDDQLEDAIEKAWKADPKLSARKLDVAVDKGVATISGDVLNAAEKARAEKLAHVTGVTSVKSEIKINPDMRSTAEKATSAAKSGTEKAANKGAEGVGVAAEKTKEGAEIAADKTKDAASKSANAVSDTWITTKVKSKMVGDKVLKGSDIDVTTDGGIVTLTGKVVSDTQRKHAISVAKATKGTKDVVDKMTITPGGTH
jgi:osmotically-inducible protein OsmY